MRRDHFTTESCRRHCQSYLTCDAWSLFPEKNVTFCLLVQHRKNEENHVKRVLGAISGRRGCKGRLFHIPYCGTLTCECLQTTSKKWIKKPVGGIVYMYARFSEGHFMMIIWLIHCSYASCVSSIEFQEEKFGCT